MLRLVMDTAGDCPAEWLDEYQINLIPINIHFGEKTFLQGVDLDNEGFYQLAESSGTIPKTSQPTPQQFIQLYRSIADPGDTILSVHVTAKLSGTYESAVLAARELQDEYNIIPFDSAAGTTIQGFMLREARLMEQQGATIDEIIKRLEHIRENIVLILALDTLEYARMSGRVKTLQAALASVLNVKPIALLRDGILDMVEKVRTRGRSLDYLVNYVRQQLGERKANVAVIHARDPQAGAKLEAAVRQALNCEMLVVNELSIGIAANLGPGTVGIAAYPVE
ncbi:MAG: DegV family protein [Anaerolineae bacterium]|nr:MAG: DegV family protein [Anaerolineae bacterium]